MHGQSSKLISLKSKVPSLNISVSVTDIVQKTACSLLPDVTSVAVCCCHDMASGQSKLFILSVVMSCGHTTHPVCMYCRKDSWQKMILVPMMTTRGNLTRRLKWRLRGCELIS